MSFYQEWCKKSEDATNASKYEAYMKEYYELEQQAYQLILSNYPNNQEYLTGTVNDLSDKLGFKQKLDIFAGFLEGINSSLEQELALSTLETDSSISLVINYEKLLYNMHAAKATWLYKLDAWQQVFDQTKLDEIAKTYRREHIATSDKIGRNDPCNCGSNKKYKACCMRKVQAS